jgi:signal transduction histidine kinase
MGSRYRLSRALTNLIQNAVEASPSGAKVHISTNVRRLESAHMGYEKVPTGEYVTATVLDEGEGILAEDLEKIFEPFYTTKKMGRSGTGLGMAVVYGAVKDHDGYIDVASGLEGGTCITLFIPTRPRAKRAADRQTPSTEDGVAEC